MQPSRLTTLALVVALLLSGAALVIAVQAASGEGSDPPAPAPVPNGAMWSLGTGGGTSPYYEWVAVYPTSSLWPLAGAPSLRFTDHADDDIEYDRSFEIGFYKYGPTWHTRNHIVEFWIGSPESGGTLSVIGNGGGGQVTVRNATDTDSLSLDYRDPAKASIHSNKSPLYLRGEGGVVSESGHTFLRGFNVPPESEHAGQVRDGDWQDGAITIPTGAVRAGSLVLVTPISPPLGAWWVDMLVERESFAVRSSDPAEQMDFNWLIVN